MTAKDGAYETKNAANPWNQWASRIIGNRIDWWAIVDSNH